MVKLFLLCPSHTSRLLVPTTPPCSRCGNLSKRQPSGMGREVDRAHLHWLLETHHSWVSRSLLFGQSGPSKHDALGSHRLLTAQPQDGKRLAPYPPPEGEPPSNRTPISDRQGINIHCFDPLRYVGFIEATRVTPGFPSGSVVKNPPTVQEMRVWTLRGEDPWRRARQPTPVFLPRESHGQRRLGATVHGLTKRRAWLSDRTHTQVLLTSTDTSHGLITLDYVSEGNILKIITVLFLDCVLHIWFSPWWTRCIHMFQGLLGLLNKENKEKQWRCLFWQYCRIDTSQIRWKQPKTPDKIFLER